MSEETTQPEISQEEAERVLKEKEQQKLTDCSNELNEVLNKYGFTLEIAHNIVLVPKKQD